MAPQRLSDAIRFKCVLYACYGAYLLTLDAWRQWRQN